jgi:hypothetical protein
MTKADLLVERSAQRLQHLASRAAQRGDGVGTWLSEELSADAAFLRKLKPSLIAARAKGDAPMTTPPSSPPPPQPSPQPQAADPPRRKPKRSKRKRGGISPLLVVGAALATGIVVAKVIDWRGHAHPRD